MPPFPPVQNPAPEAACEPSTFNLQPATPDNDQSKIKIQNSKIPQPLLADLRQPFVASGTARLTSTQLVDALRALPDRPWSQIQRGRKPITESWLGRRLSSLGLRPRNLRLNGTHTKAYDLADLSRSFPPPESVSFVHEI